MAKKFIQKAIKRPGALRKKLGVKEGHNMSMTTMREKINALSAKAKKGELSKEELQILRQMNLAMTMSKTH